MFFNDGHRRAYTIEIRVLGANCANTSSSSSSSSSRTRCSTKRIEKLEARTCVLCLASRVFRPSLSRDRTTVNRKVSWVARGKNTVICSFLYVKSTHNNNLFVRVTAERVFSYVCVWKCLVGKIPVRFLWTRCKSDADVFFRPCETLKKLEKGDYKDRRPGKPANLRDVRSALRCRGETRSFCRFPRSSFIVNRLSQQIHKNR